MPTVWKYILHVARAINRVSGVYGRTHHSFFFVLFCHPPADWLGFTRLEPTKLSSTLRSFVSCVNLPGRSRRNSRKNRLLLPRVREHDVDPT